MSPPRSSKPQVLTVRRGRGVNEITVLAKDHKGTPVAQTYANRTQAEKKVVELSTTGIHAHVTASHPFLIVIHNPEAVAAPKPSSKPKSPRKSTPKPASKSMAAAKPETKASSAVVLPVFKFFAPSTHAPHRHRRLASNVIENIEYAVDANWPKTTWWISSSMGGLKMSQTMQTTSKKTAERWVQAVERGDVRIGGDPSPASRPTSPPKPASKPKSPTKARRPREPVPARLQADDLLTTETARYPGKQVLAEPYDGGHRALTYANRAQAQKGVEELVFVGIEAHVLGKHPFLIWIPQATGKGRKPPSPRKSPPKPSKPSSSRKKPPASTPDADMADFATLLEASLKSIFPKLYVTASLINPGSPEHYVQGSFARSPRREGRAMAKNAPRFFIVVQPDPDLGGWTKGAVARIREHDKNGFLVKEGIAYPDRFTGKPMEVLAQLNEWLNANAASLVGGARVPTSPPRKTNAQHVYDALAKTGPKATTKDVIKRLQANLPGHVVEENLERLQLRGMAFSYGPSGALAIVHTHHYGPKGAAPMPMPFWATREQIVSRGIAAEADLPPVAAKWERLASRSPSSKHPPERPASARVTGPMITQSEPVAPILRIDAPNALMLLGSLEGSLWLEAQQSDRGPMNDPKGFFANLAAYQILRDMGDAAKGLIVSDIVPGSGLVAGTDGHAYALFPDGQLVLYSETASDGFVAQASRFMLVV